MILASTATDALSIGAPIFGVPLVGFIAWLILDEGLVPGRTHRRVVAENKMLREANDKVIPLVQDMVEAVESSAATMDRTTRVMEDCINALAGVHPVYKGPR